MEPSFNRHAQHQYAVKGDLRPGSVTGPVYRSGTKKRFTAVFVVSLWSTLINSCHLKVEKKYDLELCHFVYDCVCL